MNPMPRRKRWAPILTTCLAAFAEAADYRLETLAGGLDHPWSLAFLPGGSMLVTERAGQLRRVHPDGALSAPIAGVPQVYHEGQGGLFDVVLHPRFAENRLIFLSYAEGRPGDNRTAIARARLAERALEDVRTVFRVQSRKHAPTHYGGRMAFLPDETLLVTVGEGYDLRNEAQKLASQLGKTLRMNADGSPAPDNPFPNAPYVWTYGHRNPQGLVVARDGRVYLHEHGPRGGDELNVLEAGGNYGWPAVTHGLDYTGAYVSPFTHREGMRAPQRVWTPAIAPSGFAIYEGDLFPEWNGDLFVGALVTREVRRIDLEDGRIAGEESLLSELGERIRDVRAGPDGALYVLTDSTHGRIVRVLPADRPAP